MRIFLVLITVIFFSTGLMADHFPIHKIARINEIQLELNDADLAETAIFESMQSLISHPQRVIAGLEKKLERIATGAYPKATQYKAELALQFLAHPEWFSRFDKQHYPNKELFFRQMLLVYPNGFLHR